MKWFVFAILLMFCLPAAAAEYKGYPCTKDCSGHRAGYAWAAKKGIASVEDCGGASRSFREGCQSFVEEQIRAARQDSEADQNSTQ